MSTNTTQFNSTQLAIKLLFEFRCVLGSIVHVSIQLNLTGVFTPVKFSFIELSCVGRHVRSVRYINCVDVET
jgi:hypothetical protein